uniref:Plakophilin-1 n=1 Tax=Lepisosteus oculatus TaxID=7918 RepID=W5MUF2_LEPOC|nr:PREDICTED: plakophilin-1 [Lepisosteus oculatus]
MANEPLRSAMANIGLVDDTSLALPSDRKLRSGQQRVLDQVHTIKRSKSKYGSGGPVSPTSPESQSKINGFGSFKFNPQKINGSTLSRSTASGNSFYGRLVSQQKSFPPNTFQNRTTTRRIVSSSSQREFGFLPASPPSGNPVLKPSRSDPELAVFSTIQRPAVRSATVNVKTNRSSVQTVQSPSYQQSPSQPRFRVPSVNSSKLGSKISVTKSKSEQIGINGDVTQADITMQEAVEYLSSRDENYQHCGSSFIQHATFKDDKAKQEVYRLNGIPSLISLLQSSNPQIQQTASAALRNLVFKDSTNKLEVKRCSGITEAVRLLRDTDCTETQKQLTGLLWNLSSADELKPELIKTALPVLTENIVVPFAGSAEQMTSVNSNMDPEMFYNATGCLRNLSSAQQGERQTMRKCRGLVDSLMSYVQACVSADRPDDKSVENCVCILHNLTYQLETEAPSSFTTINALASSPTRDMASKNSSAVGCFSGQSSKIEQDMNTFDYPVMEDNNPKGVGWLFHSKAMQMYLSLLQNSNKDSTLEACAGALQNLTANKGIVSNVMSQTIVQKLNGLPEIARLLQSSNPSLQKTASSLLGNMSRTPGLQTTMARSILPNLTGLLSSGTKNGADSDDTLAATCHTARNLIMSVPEMGKRVLNTGLVSSLNDISKNRNFPKASKAAALLLHDLWAEKDLQSFLKKKGLSKTFFVNEITTSAHKSAQGLL